MSMLLITPMLVAQNATVSLWEENLEQLSMDEEEKNWEDELEDLSNRLQEPVNINVATKRQVPNSFSHILYGYRKEHPYVSALPV